MKHEYYDRFKTVLSDPINLKINRVSNAGQVNDGLITMCTGLKIKINSYYGSFSDIFLINGGVHEPSEEYVFYDVIKNIKNNNPIMVELGSYWAYYSMCFLQECPNGKCFLIESEESALKVGMEHFLINNFNGTFIHGKISNTDIIMDKFFIEYKLPKIDILLADIQGYEIEMLNGCQYLLQNNLIDYLFISTHSQDIHNKCIDIISKYNYKIIVSADFDNETFCYDGIIILCSKNIDNKEYKLYNRSYTDLVSDEVLNNLLENTYNDNRNK
jgi:hypothetical protein